MAETKVIYPGDVWPTGGRFVGRTPSGVVWIYYGDDAEAFRRMELAWHNMAIRQQRAAKQA